MTPQTLEQIHDSVVTAIEAITPTRQADIKWASQPDLQPGAALRHFQLDFELPLRHTVDGEAAFGGGGHAHIVDMYVRCSYAQRWSKEDAYLIEADGRDLINKLRDNHGSDGIVQIAETGFTPAEVSEDRAVFGDHTFEVIYLGSDGT